jgi:hypothetical protein
VAVLVALPVLLSGCVVIVSDSATQTEVVGPVQITTQACFSSDYTPIAPDFGCPNGNSSSPMAPTVWDFQALLAYRIPVAMGAPDSIPASGTGLGSTLTFSPDASYTAQLTALVPPPAGQRWVGYRSGAGAYTGLGGDFTVQPVFTLPRGADGAPFQGPFVYRTVTGYTDDSPTTPVDCGPVATNTRETAAWPAGTRTICVDSPTPALLATNTSLATRDLGVLGGPVHGAAVGGEGTASFTLRFAGATDPAATFSLSATTNVPGGTATPSQPTLAPATDSSTTIDVRVTVPLDRGPGNYEVTLRAALPNGQARERTVTFPVRLGAPVLETPPSISGTPELGQPLRCTLGTWHNSTTRFFTSWLRDGAPVRRSSPIHLVRPDEAGHQLSCSIRAVNDAGEAFATSAPVAIGRGSAPGLRLAAVPVGCLPARIVVRAIANSRSTVDAMTLTLDGRPLPATRTVGASAAAGAEVSPIRGILLAPINAAALRPGLHTLRATAHNAGGTTAATAPLWRCVRR